MSGAAPGPTLPQSSYLGASRAPALFGVDEYGRTELQVWAETTGRVEREDNATGWGPMDVGNELERPVLRLYCRKVGISESSLAFPGTLRHSLYPEIGATPDARRDGNRLVQVKVVGIHNAKKWGPDGDPDGVPPGVIVQAQHELAVTGAAVNDVVALVGTDVRVFTVERNDITIAELLDVEREWWDRHVVGGIAPAARPGDGDVLRQLWRSVRAGMRGATAEEAMLVDALIGVKAELGALDDRREQLQTRLQEAIADSEGLTIDDGRVVTFRQNKSGGTDWKGYALALLEEMSTRGLAPIEQVETYARPGPRVLRLPKVK